MVGVSVLVCAYNESKNIGPLLDNLLKQPFSNDLELKEILVAVSGSTDKTEEVVQGYAKNGNGIRLIVDKERRGKAVAVNQLLSEAQGDLLVFVAADTMPKMGSLSQLVSGLANERVAAVGGRPIPVNNGNDICGQLARLTWRLHHRQCMMWSEKSILTQVSGEMFAVRRQGVCLIPEDIVNDDAYIGVYLKKKGHEIMYDPKALVYIRAPTALNDYIQQRRRIIAGHQKIKKRLGMPPSTIEFMLTTRPLDVLRIIMSEIRDSRLGIFRFLILAVIEAIAYTLASLDRLTGRDHTIWDVAYSAKRSAILADE